MGSNFAGVDLASEEHEVLVDDEAGQRLLAATFAHDEAGLTALCYALLRLNVQLVAVERPEGVLIERLLHAGLRMIAIHPDQVAAARPRFRVWRGKSDRFDAFVLCELARTDSHRFRVLVPDSDETNALRALSRAREDFAETRAALSNQLRAELERFWPGTIEIFSALDSPISLAFLERYPGPQGARGLAERRPAAFLALHRYCGRKQPGELLAKLRSAPEGRADEHETDARRQIVLALVAGLRPIVAKITELTSEIAHRVRAHPDGEIFLSLFRDPKSVVARGHDHPRAIRTVGRAWLRVVWRCWQDRVPYGPTRHRGLRQHCAVAVPTSSGPRPDLAATQRMLGAAVTDTAAQRAEREAPDGEPTSADTLEG